MKSSNKAHRLNALPLHVFRKDFLIDTFVVILLIDISKWHTSSAYVLMVQK
jgi:hypothetical protein